MYDADARRRLVAHVVTAEELSTSALRRFLQERLPEYMIPSDYVFLDALPVTPSGKVDRKALPAPERVRPELDVAFAPPHTPVEEVLARLWTEVLDVEEVGIHDNFFELGGHSLLAGRMMSRVGERWQVDLPFRIAFESPTVAALARHIDMVRDEDGGAPHLDDSPRDDREELWL